MSYFDKSYVKGLAGRIIRGSITIIAAAMELQAHGYNAYTVDDVCRICGITPDQIKE